MLFNLSLKRLTKAVYCAALTLTLAVVAYPEQKASAQLSGSGLSFIKNLIDRFTSRGVNCSSNIVEVNSSDLAEFESGVTDCAVSILTLPNVEEQLVINLVNVPVVFAYNVPGFNASLSTEQACGIISGKITQWSEVGGPNLPITFVYRSDSSSTTTILNNFTENFCGFDLTPFPVGVSVEGSNGVITTVQSQAGYIGYIDRPTATQARLRVAALDTIIVGSIYVVFRSFYDDPNKATAVSDLCFDITGFEARTITLFLGFQVPNTNSSVCNAI